MLPKFCKDCKHSEPDPQSQWTLNCKNPQVNGNDPWALAYATFRGTSCSSERSAKSWFAKCGIKGKLYDPKATD